MWARMGNVPTPYELPQSPVAPRGLPPVRRLTRPVQGRHVGGVCAGLAEHLGLNVRHVRLVFLLGALAGGAGIVAYLFLWALTPQSLGEQTTPRTQAGAARRPVNESLRNLVVGLVLLVVGGVLFTQQHGVNLRLGILLPLLTVAGGAVIAWSQLDDAERGKWLVRGGADRRAGLVRLGIGIALATVGVVVLATQGQGLAGLWDVGIAAVAVLAGAGLIAAPWAVRLWGDLRVEQAERIRETARADIAGHLHDSVLQTLALIQRKADDPAEVTRLARAQERELRGWLYAGPRGSQASLASAVTEVAHEVEDLHGIPIELVVTGDRPLDADGSALVRALREALLNAVRHGSPPVSAYVEVGSGLVEAFVRDHGPGFDLDAVPEDRFGVRQSILGRMSRHGGSAAVRRLENGTEVSLSLPVTAAESPPRAQPDTEGTS
jgi:signal transduction histidine kinase/phage shock protein PspC (stress-responsive transcriptional regulator)